MFTVSYWQCFFICGEKDQFDRTSIERLYAPSSTKR